MSARLYDSCFPELSDRFGLKAGTRCKMAKRHTTNVNAEIDEELIEAYRRTTSLSFEPDDHKRRAAKILADRAIERLKIVGVS